MTPGSRGSRTCLRSPCALGAEAQQLREPRQRPCRQLPACMVQSRPEDQYDGCGCGDLEQQLGRLGAQLLLAPLLLPLPQAELALGQQRPPPGPGPGPQQQRQAVADQAAQAEPEALRPAEARSSSAASESWHLFPSVRSGGKCAQQQHQTDKGSAWHAPCSPAQGAVRRWRTARRQPGARRGPSGWPSSGPSTARWAAGRWGRRRGRPAKEEGENQGPPWRRPGGRRRLAAAALQAERPTPLPPARRPPAAGGRRVAAAQHRAPWRA